MPKEEEQTKTFNINTQQLITAGVVAVIAFVLGLLIKGSGSGEDTMLLQAEIERLENRLDVAVQQFDPATSEIKGVITGIDGGLLTVSSPTSANPFVELPGTLTYSVSGTTSIRLHRHKTPQQLDDDYLVFYEERAQYVRDFQAGLKGADEIPQEPDIHAFEERALPDLRVGHYVAIGSSDGDQALESGRLTATYVVFSEAPIQ